MDERTQKLLEAHRRYGRLSSGQIADIFATTAPPTPRPSPIQNLQQNPQQNLRQTPQIPQPSNFAMVQRLEAGMNAKRITLSSEDKIRYQKMLRDGRMNLTRQGVYDASMMNVQ